MRKSSLMRFLFVALLSCAAWGQGFQNSDIFISWGAAWSKSHAIGATNVKLEDSVGLAVQTDYGYQVARVSAASLLLDLSLLFPNPGLKANVPVGRANLVGLVMTAGLRVMVPVHSRLSFYALSGGGWGSFGYPVVTGGDSPQVSTNTTHHGVFVFGGGADVRLTRWFSIRGDLRDVVTGRELGGVPGRHHLLPSCGVAFHH